MEETTIGPSKKLPSKLPATKIVGPKSSSSSPKPKGKTALSYTTFADPKSGKEDKAGSATKYRKYAGSYQKGEMYQGASGTWYKDGKRVGSGSGPATLKNPEAVQRAYNMRVAKDLESRTKKSKHKLRYE